MASASSVPPPREDSCLHLNEYELLRLSHIRRNHEYMMRLGIKPLVAAMNTLPNTHVVDGPATPSMEEKKQRKRRSGVSEGCSREPSRKSHRIASIKPEVDLDTARKVVDGDDDWDNENSEEDDNAGPKQRASKYAKTEDAVKDAQAYLESTRSALNVQFDERAKQAGDDSDKWHAEAVRRWGASVGATEVEPITDWKAFVVSRNTTPPPVSNTALLQEFYAHDCWQLLVVCVLMSRVSSWEVKDRVVSAFFEAYPTPSAVVAGDVTSDALFAILKPLGLFPFRFKSLMEITRTFLSKPRLHVDLGDNKVYGLGAFGVENYRVFCRGDLSGSFTDTTIKGYVTKALKKKKDAQRL